MVKRRSRQSCWQNEACPMTQGAVSCGASLPHARARVWYSTIEHSEYSMPVDSPSGHQSIWVHFRTRGFMTRRRVAAIHLLICYGVAQ